mgnify:CR=1 FL=1
MAKKNSRNTKGRIISAAWKLFYEQGYEGTTVEDIVFESGTSKGSFYHYFDGKDALMGTLAYVFDEKYEELIPALDPNMGALETLAYINHELYVMIEASVSIDLLTRLLSTQLLARGEKHLLDRSRVYFRLLRRIVRRGAERGLDLDPSSVFDGQIKRFHEYKRQQMNALAVIHQYLEIKAGRLPQRPVTVLFGGKAAPAYVMAKHIIHLILCLQKLIEQDPQVRPWLRVAMVENYNVTWAEALIPACDLSEQISLASKEASGTGNMKFMANGVISPSRRK